jgi:hypothetical protein
MLWSELICPGTVESPCKQRIRAARKLERETEKLLSRLIRLIRRTSGRENATDTS